MGVGVWSHSFVQIMGVCFSYVTAFSLHIFEGLVVPLMNRTGKRERVWVSKKRRSDEACNHRQGSNLGHCEAYCIQG